MRFGVSSTTLALVLPPAPNREGRDDTGEQPQRWCKAAVGEAM